MKIVNMVCPNCGASLQVDADKKNLTCNYCDNNLFIDDEVHHVQYDNAEEAGYQFEKGRQRAQSELKVPNSGQSINFNPNQQPKKKRTWLWVLGWIFIFPVPLTILLLRNKTLDKKLKYGIIAAAWIIYLIVALAGRGTKDNNSTSQKVGDNTPSVVHETDVESTADTAQETNKDNDTTSNIVSPSKIESQEETEDNILSETNSFENEQQSEATTILYADDSNINKWLNRYNSLYPDSKLTSEDFTVYHHHGSDHKNQIKLTIDDFPMVLTSGKAIITCYQNGKTTEDCQKLFCKIVPIYCPDLSEEEVMERWNEVMDDITNTVTFDDKLDVSFQIYSDTIEMMEIDGDLQ